MKTPSQITTSLSRTLRAWQGTEPLSVDPSVHEPDRGGGRGRRRGRTEPLTLDPSPHRMGRGKAAVSRFGAIIALGVALVMFQSANAAMLHHWDFKRSF
jgi:hypothetical protein